MALVALEFEDDKVFVAAAKTSGKRVEVSHLFSVDLNGSDQEAADKLKSALSEHGCSRADAIIVVSRSDAEMREIEVPPAPTNELPDMVRLIARNEFASMNDNWAFDFVPLSDDETKMRKVIAAGISPEMKSQVTKLAEDAGLRIKHMVLRPYSAIGLVEGRLADYNARILLNPSGDTTDISILDGQKVLGTRTVRVPGTYDGEKRIKALASEVKRTFASSRKILAGKEITEVIILDDDSEGEHLKSEFTNQEYDVQLNDPVSLASVSRSLQRPANGARYAGLLGAIEQHSKQNHLIDFVNPRRPIVKKRDLSKILLYGGIALATLLFAVGFGWWKLNSQAKEIASLEEEYRTVKEQAAGTENRPGADDMLDEVGMIDNWVKTNVNWLEELYQISDRALTPDDTIVDSFDAEVNRRAEDMPRIIVNSKMAGVQIEEELLATLDARPYIVEPARGSGSDDETYPLANSMRINVMPKGADFIKAYDVKAEEFMKARNELREANKKKIDSATGGGDAAHEDTPDSESAAAPE